ncbi:uncharacterized protein LOC105248411 [Camponotus floridanus]|uniref:uncharacterized protein LOC105248411 n=1 Tax=Camponotus floridanus TaxID=104421 RepID=UPI00059D4E51|nr:uncharacterized protein LOC105248411 [Camponotus floridanus]
MRVLLIVGLIICVVDGSIIPDEALTARLQDVWNEDEFIALSNIKAEKKSDASNSIETLWAYLGAPIMKTFILYTESLDESSQRNAVHINVDFFAVNTPLKSLIILVHQTGGPT